jgi:glycosyltransferase involved in cell wall biosynthesis
MNLLIVSHTAHHLRNGEIVGWGATVREIDHLATLFDRVVHIATMHPGAAPDSAIPYQSGNVILRPVAPSGGEGVAAKMRIASAAPAFMGLFRSELRHADVVHVRCPANISMMAVVLLSVARKPGIRWAKYAGNWSPDGREPLSYTFQRWWLRRGLHRGIVTVNGRWPGQPAHVHAFLNPSLTDRELCEARFSAAARAPGPPFRLVLVGRLDAGKGAGRAVEALAKLRDLGIDAALDIIGDGPERTAAEQLAAERHLGDAVSFRGWVPRHELGAFYARAHFMLLPSSSEGWPKVLSEAMAYGVVPVCSRVGSIAQYLSEFGVGRTFAPSDTDGMASAVAEYASDLTTWTSEADKGMLAAEQFSYTNYLRAVRRTVLGEGTSAVS